jgi:hypothetical protein
MFINMDLFFAFYYVHLYTDCKSVRAGGAGVTIFTNLYFISINYFNGKLYFIILASKLLVKSSAQ